jgi:hypothetical protein
VSEGANGCLSVAYGDLLALVVEAIKELSGAQASKSH